MDSFFSMMWIATKWLLLRRGAAPGSTMARGLGRYLWAFLLIGRGDGLAGFFRGGTGEGVVTSSPVRVTVMKEHGLVGRSGWGGVAAVAAAVPMGSGAGSAPGSAYRIGTPPPARLAGWGPDVAAAARCRLPGVPGPPRSSEIGL